MKNPNDSFIRGRLRSFKFALRGMWLLMTTEDSIKAQLFVAVLATILGFYFNISNIEWMFQFIVIGLVLVAEALNTAIEKVADFVHPDYHEKIGFIKDIAAGAPSFAAFTSLIIAGFIYIPKITILF
ncbi:MULTISPECIES: diacylglycerol kinase family protein [unclassified Polaribacter]|jgi:diacylglycerol kinase (ATP)|uniref:diacylglycerol kinase family protein n=1 Tax=unclassified Polaribacter TaxID=196858 RepID=UPI001C4F641E|nr:MULTISPECIES: diacylglycerol kinase family protein [unclassified Polaribacter]QXP64847.1 diacylglycerol kinase family protein [Polaribacter sp. HaHaR_3_91]QXP67343.1 diacylglycerol kinase family protein [Polaribacter sp. AHE13PA]QXP69496.1 diacylglycerol kinase family protein [Polaribacter sp. R2A056_3_33]